MNKHFITAALLLLLGLLITALTLPAMQPQADGYQLSAESREPIAPNSVPQWGLDMRVNPTPSGTPALYKNHSLAINPANTNILLASYEVPFSNTGIIGYGWSTDAGRTWAAGSFQGLWGDELTPELDTHVAFDANGVGYYTALAAGSNYNGYYILTTTNGIAWSTPQPVIVTDYSESRRISNVIIDTNPNSPYVGSIYMFWLYSNNNFPFFQGVWMRVSRDGGLTWSEDVQVADVGHEHSYGAFATVASDGSVYVSFVQVNNNYIFNPYKLYLDRSTDGGETWGTDKLITGAPITVIGRPDFKDREWTLIGNDNALECTLMHAHHFPSIAVLPANPNKVYVVWNDGRWETPSLFCGRTGRHSDIAFSSSGDGGQTWTAPIRINDDPISNGLDQFHPSIAIRPDGLIGATWIDRRFDPGGWMYDLMYSQSSDNGVTWSVNQRVSDSSNNPNNMPDYKGLDDLGFRNPLVMSADYVIPSWIDAHVGTREGYFAVDRGAFPTATATRTPAPPTSTPTPPTLLVGHAVWQGRPVQPNPLQQLPVTLTLKLKGIETNYAQQTTNASGYFTVAVSGLVPGTYDWRAKGPKYLAKSGTVALTGGPITNLEMGLFNAGDASNDNIISVLDFNILKLTFGKAIGDPGYDDRADFTGDQTVNVADFNPQKVNFGQGGAPPITAK